MRPAFSALVLGLLLGLAPGTGRPAMAAQMGHMEVTIGGRRVAYVITDNADEGSGWEIPAEDTSGATRHLSILWKGPIPTDMILVEMTLRGTTVLRGRVLLPEAKDGAEEAKLPATLHITLDRVAQDGPWLKIAGRLRGTLYPLRRGGQLLPDDGVAIRAHFDTWVPGIAPPPPKTKTKAKTTHPGHAPTQSQRPRLRSTE